MKTVVLILLFLTAFGHTTLAATKDVSLSYTDFAHLPVQSGGRVKPIDTFATSMIRTASGATRVDGLDADAWFAEVLFDPAGAMERRSFRTFSPSVLGLPERDGHLYSFTEIAPALAAKAATVAALAAEEQASWSADDHELMRLQEAASLYGGLLRSFYYLMPLGLSVPDALAKDMGLAPDAIVSLETLTGHKDLIAAKVAALLKAKGDDQRRYTEAEKQLASFAFDVAQLQAAGRAQNAFPIVPATGGWRGPGRADGEAAPYVSAWERMAHAYRAGDGASFAAAARDARAIAETFPQTETVPVEMFYNAAHPLDAALIFYGLAFLAAIVWGLRGGDVPRFVALGLLLTGTIANAVAIALRVAILARPPVGTLYESVVFVACVCAAIAVAIEWRRKDGTGILAGPASALVLLFCARGFADEDSMQVLVAVLNTNFWLATHVLCITAGYGWCVIASLAAHVSLARAARGDGVPPMMPTIKTLSLVALLFTAVGTILGGIWADQSWGRFWGWDPKENGALLIVLWLIWLLHGQIGGQVNRLWFTGGIAALSVVVAISWFGVNLLGTGLHSYGFITGVAASLAAFCAVEATTIAGLMALCHRKAGTR